MCGPIVIYVVLGLLVPGIIHAQCPTEREVQGFSCGTSRDRSACPAGSTCMGRRCCWEETAPVSSPCDDPYMQDGALFTCDVQGQGQSQGQGQACPGNCYSCRVLSGLDGMGLCCPETQRQGCASASPAQVAFEREAQRIRGGTATGTGSTGTGSASTGSSSTFGVSGGSGTSMQDTRFADQGSFQSGRTQDRTPARGPSRFASSNTPMRASPVSDPRLARPMGPRGPCGVGVRPIGTCRRMAMVPPCPRGFYCAPNGFMGVCCPAGSSPFPRPMIDRRMGPAGLSGPVDRFPGSFPGAGDRTRFGAGSGRGFSAGGSTGGSSSGRFTGGAGTVGGSGQFSGRSTASRTGSGTSGTASTGGGTAAGSFSSDFDRQLFGPPPREDFPGGPIATRNTPRGECPRTIPCSQSGWNDCYTDAQCPVPMKCCSPRAGCLRKCM